MPTRSSPFAQLAHEKLVRVLGTTAGQRAYDRTLSKIGLTDLATADDLHAFADGLAELGGMHVAIAALLRVSALVQGAKGPSDEG